MEIITERIKTVDGVEAFLARPKDQKAPAVLVHFEIFGVNGHIQEVCRRIAAEGYVALAADYYWRLETRTAPYTDLPAAFALASSLKDEEVLADAGSCLRYLTTQQFVQSDGMGTLGFCMGGRLSFLTATRYPKEISAAISFYGGGLAGENRRAGQALNPMEEATKVRCPLLLFYGELDQHITADHVDQFTGRLKQLGKGFQSYVYRGAGHGFFCIDRGSYSAEAAKDAWQKVVEFLECNVKGMLPAAG
ncbi:MAG: dienelactone hydrolase family protein [Acidobacteria bacterium]|nr:dienelactone hydrolase family protein [Acidobacteriota bacterium]